MTSGSIVLYKTDVEMASEVIDSFFRGNSSKRKLFLVDNSPTDELEILKQRFPHQTEYIHNPSNTGYGSAHNIAIRRSFEEGFKYHVVLNPDLSFDSETIDGLQLFMEEHPDVGLCIPDMFDYQTGERKAGARLLPSPFDGFFRRFMTKSSITKKRDREYLLKDADYTKPFNAPYISGSFMFFRNECLKDIGLFDEHFFMYYEDTDISRRMYCKYRNSFVPGVSARHIGARESYKSKKMLFVTLKSAVYYFNKYGWFFDKQRRQINKTVLNNLNSSN